MENRLHRRHPLIQFVLDNWFYIALAILMWQLPHWLSDHFDQPLNPRRIQGSQPLYWMSVFINLYILMILAMSYNLVFGFGGILSFGHALFFGAGVYLIAIQMTHFNVRFVPAFGVTLSIAVILALIYSLAAFRIKGVYFAMFTLAMSQIFYEIARINLFKFLTAGDDGLTFENIPEWINPVQSRLTFYYICAFLAGLTFLTIKRLMNSPTGKVILAIRDNEERAQTMGYNTALYKMIVISMSGFFAALAGILQALFNRQAEPSALSLARTVDPLLMTIIGGTGTHPGPAIGAIIMHLGETFFRKPELHINLDFILFRYESTVNSTELWRLILGLMFIGIVLGLPYGVVGQINQVWVQARRWLRKFIFDPLVRAYPNVAEIAAPVTGEPPAFALAVAEHSRGASVIAWAKEYPLAAAASIALSIATLSGIAAQDQHLFFSIVLFSLLILVPLFGVIWLMRNANRVQTMFSSLFR